MADNVNKNSDRKLEELLDHALADYSNVEPRTGLETRILARLATANAEAPRTTWLRWWPALSLAAAALVVLAIFLASPKTVNKIEVKQTPPALPNSTTLSPANSQQLATLQPKKGNHRHPATQRASNAVATVSQPPQLTAIKQDVFPAPSPLTDQEKLLFAYLRRTGPQEIAANAKPDDAPVPEKQINQASPLQKNADSNTNTK
jgi:hypothetical protein